MWLSGRALHLHRRCLESLLCLPHVVGVLLCQPQAGLTATVNTQPGLDAQGHFRRNGGAAIQDAGQSYAGDAELLCSFRDGQLQSGKHVVTQRQAGPLRFGEGLGSAPAKGFTLSALLQACPGTLPGLRDGALLSLAYDTGLRVSELVRVACDHITVERDGSAVLTVPRSKTDQEGQGGVLVTVVQKVPLSKLLKYRVYPTCVDRNLLI